MKTIITFGTKLRAIDIFAMNTTRIVRVSLIVLLLLCLLPMPYGYYTCVRLVAMAIFAMMAMFRYKRSNYATMCFWGTLALLFQPFIKLALGRIVWNIVDVIVATILLILLVKEWKTSSQFEDL